MRRDGDETRRDETSLYNKGRRLDEVKADNHAFKGWSDVSFFCKKCAGFCYRRATLYVQCVRRVRYCTSSSENRVVPGERQ